MASDPKSGPLRPAYGMEGDGDFEILNRETPYRGFAQLHVYRARHRLHRGGWSGEIRREVFDSGSAIVVLPYDAKRDEVVMVEQFRAPPLLNRHRPWLIECIAGRVENSASAEEAARREAKEEADCTLGRVIPIGGMYASPGIFAEYVHYFVGEADTGAIGGVHGLDEESEDIRVHVVGFEEAMRALGDGRLQVAPAFVALQWLALNRERLRREWGGAQQPRA